MTLIQAAATKNFILMTADKKEVMVYHKRDKKGNYVQNNKFEPELLRNDQEKLSYLTNYVMVGSGGFSIIGNFIEDFIKGKVGENDGLYACKEALEQSIEEIRKGNCSKDIKDLFHSDEGVGVILSGYDEEGRSGIVTFQSGGTIEHFPIEGNTFTTSSINPTNDLRDSLLADTIIKNQSGDVNGFVNSMAWVHACVSKIHHELVSSDMHYYLLARDGANALGEYDTAELYPMIEENEETVNEMMS